MTTPTLEHASKTTPEKIPYDPHAFASKALSGTPTATVEQLLHGRAIIAHRDHLRAQLAEVLDEVVGEGVVVVEDQDSHGQSGWSYANSIARIAAVDFATDSSYS